MTNLAPAEPDRLSYRMDEAARLMGLSESTLWRLRKDNKLATVKIGSRTLITRSELERLLSEGASSPRAA